MGEPEIKSIAEEKRNLKSRIESAIRFFEVGTGMRVIAVDIYHGQDTNGDILLTDLDITLDEQSPEDASGESQYE